MDGWETRRKRIAGHDWCIVQLGLPGVIEGFEFDTAFFTGNHVPKVSVQGIYISPDSPLSLPPRSSLMGTACSPEALKAADAIGSDSWKELLPTTSLEPGYPETRHNFFDVDKDVGKVSHLRINLYPDGGIARFRAHGVVDKDWTLTDKDELLDLVRVDNGGQVLEVSDSHYGHPSKLLLTVPPVNMSSGWETSRNPARPSVYTLNADGQLEMGDGKQHTVIKLGHPGLVEKIVIDTSWFKGNFPESVVVEGALLHPSRSPTTSTVWHTLLPRARMGPHAAHTFTSADSQLVNADKPISHVKLTMMPDGGIARFNVIGKLFLGEIPEPGPEQEEEEEEAAGKKAGRGKRKAKEEAVVSEGRKSKWILPAALVTAEATPIKPDQPIHPSLKQPHTSTMSPSNPRIALSDSSASLIDLAKHLPFLPGTDFSRSLAHRTASADGKVVEQNYRKSHAFDVKNGVSVYVEGKPGIGGEDIPGQNVTKIKTSLEVYPKADASETVPAWVAFDRKVLRFYGFFQEAVQERREEQHRIRKVNIYFYLEDDTIQVTEPRANNSGLMQGTLIRRHRIPLPNTEDGQHHTITDLNVGKEVTLYARTFKIVGCDGFTREFLTALNLTVPENTDSPPDPYTLVRAELQSRLKATRPCPPHTSLKTFLENDRRVLRFYATWDDRGSTGANSGASSSGGELRHMVVHYYLATEELEVRTAQGEKGKGTGRVFLKRGKVAKRAVKVVMGVGGTGNQVYYGEGDLQIGAVVHIYGRPFMLVDCDEFTKEYYADKYGLTDFTPIHIDDPHTSHNVVTSAPAPPLVPRPHRKDFERFAKYDTTVLRWRARLRSDRQVDKGREFVLGLYMQDETISVDETTQASGMSSGRFLKRARVPKRPIPPSGSGSGEPSIEDASVEYYGAKDFAVGKDVTLYGRVFEITACDGFTEKFVKDNARMFM
ncbi:EF-hand domain-containing member C2 [Gonapodya sp. JEL0774]|nr:EF-hand domain-containing member C2 [Gonapodya sp. JEL0774]